MYSQNPNLPFAACDGCYEGAPDDVELVARTAGPVAEYVCSVCEEYASTAVVVRYK